MKMSIDEAIEMLKKDKEQRGECFISNALDMSIDTMRKLQEISRIANRWKCYGGDHVSMQEIYEVLNGNEDCL